MDSEQPQKPVQPPDPDEDGNFDAPALQALRQVWDDFCEEEATEEDVLSVVHEIGGFAQSQLDLLEKQVDEGASDPENKSFTLIFEGFELLLEACETMLLEFADELPEDVEESEDGFFAEGYELAQEATNQMMDGHKMAMEHIEAMAEVNCLFCGHPNPRGSQKCGKCGRPLPVSADEPRQSSVNVVERQGLETPKGPEEGSVTKNYAAAAQLLEGWKAGTVDAEELGQFLDFLDQNFQSHMEETFQHAEIAQQAPDHQREALLDAIELTRKGLDMSLAAVEKMRMAFESQDDRYLFFGLSDLEEASKVMLEAYWANKEAAAG